MTPGELSPREAEPELYFISYPKSGRTWLRMMVGKALGSRLGIPDREVLRTRKITSLAPDVGLAEFSHDDADFPVHFRRLASGKSCYREAKVVFLTRAIDDLMVSAYFQATRRERVFSGPISAFLRDPRLGVRKAVRFYQIWHRHRETPAGFLHITYEDMHARPRAVLRKVLAFMGRRTPGEAAIRAAVEFASFANMQSMEKSDFFSHTIMRPGRRGDPESYKVRRGRVGAAREYLSASDLDYIASVVRRSNCPFVTLASRPT